MTVKERLELKKKLRPKQPKIKLIKGDKGTSGQRGIPGKTGSKGLDGTNGTNGLNGTDGRNGSNGQDGINGVNGENAKQIELVSKQDKLYWRYQEEEWQLLAIIPKGERGPRGIGGGVSVSSTVAGEMYITNTDTYTLNVTIKDVYLPLSDFHKGKENRVTVDESAGTFTIQEKGTYKFDGVATLSPSAGMILYFAVFVNDVFQINIETGIDFKNSQNAQTFSGTGMLDLVKGDVVTLRGKTDTAPVTMSVNDMNVHIHRIGR